MGADLILVGSHGHGAIGRFLLGSVAQAVLRTATCSVEIVRTPNTSRAVPRRVLLATDGSDCSLAAAHAMAAELWPEGSVFKLLSAEESLIVGNETAYPNSLIEELIAMAQDRARSAVEQAKNILQRAGLTVDDASSVPPGEPRSIILDEAKEWGAELIVLGSHGRRGLDRLLVGSVSEAVAVHA
jgi:nucleotide-binding universal stress UspA family protein